MLGPDFPDTFEAGLEKGLWVPLCEDYKKTIRYVAEGGLHKSLGRTTPSYELDGLQEWVAGLAEDQRRMLEVMMQHAGYTAAFNLFADSERGQLDLGGGYALRTVAVPDSYVEAFLDWDEEDSPPELGRAQDFHAHLSAASLMNALYFESVARLVQESSSGS